MMNTDIEIQRIYDQLWGEAKASFQPGQVETDPFLLNRQNDHRRGLTVIARLSDEVAEQIEAMLDDLRLVADGQHYYRRSEMHMTVLSVITVTEDYEPYMEKTSAYLAAIGEALAGAKGFCVQFSGITASKGAVMVQGFPGGPQLEDIRERLREILQERGLSEGVDKRYLLRTAHSTVMRFQRQLAVVDPFIEKLERYRGKDFGVSLIDQLLLVKNDWYMSYDRVEVLERYSLG